MAQFSDAPAARPQAGGRRSRATHLVHVFPSFDIGGAQVRFVSLAEALGEAYAHTVISLSDTYGAAPLLAPGARVSYAKAPEARSTLRRLQAYRRQLGALNPDLLLTYNWGAIEYALANRFGGAPHLHMEDGFGPDEVRRQLRRRVWTRRLALSQSEVVAPSLTLKTIATSQWRLDARRVHHVPNGIAPKSECSTALADLGLRLPAGRPKVVWAGALRPEKNPVRLLRAFAPLRNRATLILIGDGPDRPRVLEEAERLGLGDSLCLAGRRNDTRDLIMQCDVLALSSDTEQMPLVVLEAMDAGLPVASVDVGDVRRMLAEENRPYVTPVDEVALGQAIEALASAPELRRKVGEANRRRVRDVYGLPRMVAAYEGLIRQTISAAGRECIADA